MFRLPSKIIPRPLYMDRIRPFIGQSLIKVLTGHRRVGKSYLLYQVIEQVKSENPEANVIFINKEDLAFEFLSTYRDLYEYICGKLIPGVKNYIFIDEIQEIEDFHKAIRSLALDLDNDIYITGSNSNLLSSDIANQLGGRYIRIEVFSLSYMEFLKFHNLKNEDESLLKYTKFGGLPYLINLSLEEDIVGEYISGIYSTVIFRDVIRRHNIRNTAFLEQLIYYLANNVGNLFSLKSISDFLKSQKVNISPNQVGEYTDKLTGSYLINKVKRYDIIGKRNFEIGEKYYFENTGILNLLAPFKPTNKEKYLENLVFNHMYSLGYDVKIGMLNKNEIDFICIRNNEKVYIQVALELQREETIKREIGNLMKIKDNYPKYVVTEEKGFTKSEEGIEIINIRDFLSNDRF